GGVEPLACIRVHTDEGISGLSEVFRVPPGVVRATVGGIDTHFGRLLIGQEITHPERLWQRVWDALIHTNRRGWEIIILGPRDVVEIARRFRKSLGAAPTLMIDVGYLFHDVPTAARVCRELEEFDVYFFETPFAVDSPGPYAELAGRTSIPLAMGEHGVTRW